MAATAVDLFCGAGGLTRGLLDESARLVRELKPDVVSMENVPELQRHSIFDRFLAALDDEGFHFTEDREKQVVYCPDYGIPEHRRRLVLDRPAAGAYRVDAGSSRPAAKSGQASARNTSQQ